MSLNEVDHDDSRASYTGANFHACDDMQAPISASELWRAVSLLGTMLFHVWGTSLITSRHACVAPAALLLCACRRPAVGRVPGDHDDACHTQHLSIRFATVCTCRRPAMGGVPAAGGNDAAHHDVFVLSSKCLCSRLTNCLDLKSSSAFFETRYQFR